MNAHDKPVPSREGVICGDMLYWITMIGTVVALAGMVYGFTTDHNYNLPSSWISSIWDGRHTEDIWASNTLDGLTADIKYLAVSGDELIADTKADGSGIEYVIELSDGKLEMTIPDGIDPESVQPLNPTGGSLLQVEYQGADFTIRDQAGTITGTGTVATDSSPYGVPGTYQIVAYAVGDIDETPGDEVILLANEVDAYPGQVYMVHADGTLLERFWNPGHVDAVAIHDVNDDGSPEVIIGATNQDQLWSHISTPAIYALEAPFDEPEMEAPPYQGTIGEGEEVWAEFPDTEEVPLRHWYLSHLSDGDGIATLGTAIGVFSVIPALVIPALLYTRRKSFIFAFLALLAAVVTIASMMGMTPLPS